MKKFFLLIPALILSMMMNATKPTINIDGDKSDWAEVPMLSQPGTWPMLKVLPAADGAMGSNALAFMLEGKEDFVTDWSKYPGSYIDADNNLATNAAGSWVYNDMGIDYSGTTGGSKNSHWIDFEKAVSGHVIEMGIPTSFIDDLQETFAIGMYYGTGGSQEWFLPTRSGSANPEVSGNKSFIYKTRPYVTLPGILSANNAFTHQSIGECTEYVDFGLRDNGNDTARWAAFPFELTTPAKFDLTANVSSSNSWSFEFWVVDVATNQVVQHMDNSGDISSSKIAKKMGVLDLSSVPAGKYMLKVKNKTCYSKVKLYNIILTAQEGSVSALPCTLVPMKAITTAETCIDAMGEEDTIRFYSPITSQEIKWNISVAEKRPYQFTANTFNQYGHNYKITILSADESQVIQSYQEKASGTIYSYGHVRVHTPTYELEPGNYVIKIQNLTNADGCRLTTIETNGALVNTPNTLQPIDALLSDSAGVVFGEPNYINFKYFKGSSHLYNNTEWAKWCINVEKGGYYTFTLNANSTNSHSYLLSVLEPNETVVETYPLDGSYATPMSKTTDWLWLPQGEYQIKVENTIPWSEGYVSDITVSYVGGAISPIPGQILGIDALLKKESTGTKTMIRLENGDIKSSNNGYPTTEYAEWNINATRGEYQVTLNLDPITSSGHNYRIELYNGNALIDYSEELSSAEPGDAVHEKGDLPLAKTLTIPSDGAYTLKLINRTQWSSMILHGITFTPYVAPSSVVMIDTDTDNSRWIADLNNTVDVQMTRTILGGMYNTICLPFKVSSTQCKAIFGNDVELYTLGSATLSGDILNLQFNTASDIWNGTPILIKTSSDIVNPLFENVTIESETADHTNGGFVTFQGTFVQKDFHNGDQVLLLMANNQLAYPQQDRTLKGFRAYFQINGGANSAPIRRANIITPNKVPTEINLVELENNGIIKTIENGQLIIIRDGVRYNAMGVMIE